MFAWILGTFVIISGLFGALVSPVAQHTLERQLNERYGPFQHLEVKAPTDPSKLLHGYFDRLEVNAEGFKVAGLGVRSTNIITSPVQVNLGQALRGIPTLKYDVLATASTCLEEGDLNTWLQTPQVKEKLRHIPVPPGMLNANEASLESPVLRLIEDRLEVAGTLTVSGTSVPFAVSGSPVIRSQALYLDGVQISMMGMPLPAFLYENAFKSPVQLPKVAGFDYHITSLDVNPGAVELVTALTIMDSQ